MVNGFIFANRLKHLLNNRVQSIFTNMHLAIYMSNGCRDKATASFLEHHGIQAFFNYCLTLTLDKRNNEPKDGKIFVVDVIDDKRTRIESFFKRILKDNNIVCITHDLPNASYETKMKEAQELLNTYKKEAQLVITKRLYCTLPCIAMVYPLYYLEIETILKCPLHKNSYHYTTVVFQIEIYINFIMKVVHEIMWVPLLVYGHR